MVSHDAAGSRCTLLPLRQIWFIEGSSYHVTIRPFDTPQYLFLRLT